VERAPVNLRCSFFTGTGLFAYYQTHPEDLEQARTAVAVQKLASEGVKAESENYAQVLAKRQAAITGKDIGDKIFSQLHLDQSQLVSDAADDRLLQALLQEGC